MSTSETLQKLAKKYAAADAILAFASCFRSSFRGVYEERITLLFDTPETRTAISISFHTSPSGRLKKGWRVWVDVNRWNEFNHDANKYTGRTAYNHDDIDDAEQGALLIKAIRETLNGMKKQHYSTPGAEFLQAA